MDTELMKSQFSNVAKLISLISRTGPTTIKNRMLLQFQEMPLLKPILKHLFDPYTTTGIKDKSLFDALGFIIGTPACPPFEVLDYIEYATTNNTGDSYSLERGALMYKWAQSIDEESAWLMYGIITKNLQIGVKATTLNKLYGNDFIPVVGIMRGMHAPANFAGTYVATEKIDGNRRIIVNDENGVEIYTRSGRRDEGLVELEEQAHAYLPRGYVYDTECVAAGEFEDNVALRQASAALLNSKGIRRGVLSKIFDMMPISDYKVGICKIPAIVRKAMIAQLFGDDAGLNMLSEHYTPAPYYMRVDPECTAFIGLPVLGIVHNMAEAKELAKPVWDRNGEGLMLVDISSPYEVSPNPRKTLLKIKATEETVVQVVDVLEGTNSNEGRMGSVLVVFTGKDGKEYTFGVGSGFTQWEREYYWDSPEMIVGKMIEVEHFGESLNKDGSRALNCPIFKRIVGDEER